MALSNQATISIQVNVQNMQGIRNLQRGLQSLVSQIRTIQRNPGIRSGTGSGLTPAQQARQQAALNAAQIRGAAQVGAAMTKAATQTKNAQSGVVNAMARSLKAAMNLAGAQ